MITLCISEDVRPPSLEVVVGRPQVEAQAGQTIRMECTVRGSSGQAVDIRWTRVGQELPQGNTVIQLPFQRVSV